MRSTPLPPCQRALRPRLAHLPITADSRICSISLLPATAGEQLDSASSRPLAPSRGHALCRFSALACRSAAQARSLHPAPRSCSMLLLEFAGAGRPGPAPPVVPRSAMRRRAGFGNPTRLVARSFAPRSCAASLTPFGPRVGCPGFGMPFLPSRALPALVPPSMRGEVSRPGSCHTR